MTVAIVEQETGREVQLFDAFAYNGQYEVKATGFKGTALAGQTTTLDFRVGSEDRHINGVRLIFKNHAIDDTIALMVADPDGVIPEAYRAAYPSYPILKQFGYSWNVDESISDQGRDIFNFVAKINAGLSIRVMYTSTGSSDVIVKLNAMLHKKL